MNRHIVFLIISGLSGCGAYFLALPKLDKIQILYNAFDWIYQRIWVYYHLNTDTFFALISFIFAIIVFIALEIIWIFTDEKPVTTRGDAKWLSIKDVKDLITKKGVPVGRLNNQILRIDKTHLVTCAGTRSGKGVGAIIPTLLEYPDSLVCLDIKGENYAVTANRRRELSSVYVLNPFGLLDIPTNSYNWLDSINTSQEDCIEKALKMASMLVGTSSDNSTENHFNEQAIRLLQGVILYVCSEDDLENRNICTVAKLIHEVPIKDLCNAMKQKENAAFEVISDIGAQFLNNDNDKEIGSILSTAQRATNFLDNPNIKKTLTKSDFEISYLPDKKMSIYLIMPQDKIDDFSAYIRVFFDLALSSIISRKSRGKYEVLFLLDEVAQLGYMKNLSKAISILRGLGGQMWFFFQGYSQIKDAYGKEANNILNNSTQIYYGCNEQETAELISRILGKKTIKEIDPDTKKGHYIEKSLMAPNEVRRLSPEFPIIIMPGRDPIKVKRLCYYKDKEYKGLFDSNPFLR